MSGYASGIDALGAPMPVCVEMPWWETAAIVVGALSSLAVLLEITFGRRR